MKIDANKNWKWFGNCMTKEANTNGLTWKYSKEGSKDWIRIGEMKDGNLHGWGVHVFLDGRKLVLGCSSKGVFYQATVLWENGATYVGQLDNVKNGWGVMTWTDGNIYQGEWKDDKREGNGILIWANGSKYDGEWRSSKIEGKGIHTLPNGDTLTGDWKNGKAHGHCHMFLKSIGFEYEGEWSNGEPNDQESCLHPSLRKCLKENVCTANVTGTSTNYGQFFYRCSTCNINYCTCCWDSCHSCLNNCLGTKKWGIGVHCSCAHNSKECKKNGDSPRPSKKQKLI